MKVYNEEDRRQANTSTTRFITRELVESVRTVNPIEHVAGEHTQLRRCGVQLVGRCPLHSEKTPSFSVHPSKQVYRCHGCGAGGDVIDFVRRIHNCSFHEAVRVLAARAEYIPKVSSRHGNWPPRSPQKRRVETRKRALRGFEMSAFGP
jgi:DNA primase